MHENVQLVHNSPDFIYHQLVDFGIPTVREKTNKTLFQNSTYAVLYLQNLAGTLVQTHTHESERSPSSDFYTLTGQLPTPISVWLRSNLQRFSNAPSRTASVNPITPRATIPTARPTPPPTRPARPARLDLALKKIEKSKSNTVFPPFRPPPVPDTPIAALEKLELLEDTSSQHESDRDSLSPSTSYPFTLL